MSETDVRESMRRLPGFAQPFLTWLTGKPLRGQRPWFRHTPLTQTVTTLASLFGGVALAVCGYRSESPVGYVLVLIAWFFIVGGARKMQVTICHQCAHHAFSGWPRFDRWFTEFFTTVLGIDHFESYQSEHVRIHHTKKLASRIDPDCKFLLELGFRPGLPAPELKRHLRTVALSPRFHAKFLWARLRANFVAAPALRRAMAMLYAGSVLVCAARFGVWGELVVAWVIPLTALYQVAALLNFSSLHFWLQEADPSDSAKETLCSLTAGRFSGEVAPRPGLARLSAVRAWARWSARMGLVHLPVRLAVLVGDLPVHDHHHRYPRCADWPNYLYTRQHDLERGCPGWGVPYAEIWGLGAAIDEVMRSISRATPLDARVVAAGAPIHERLLVQL